MRKTAEDGENSFDIKVKRIFEILPHLNCGLCGYVNCAHFASAVAKGEASILDCQQKHRFLALKLPYDSGPHGSLTEIKKMSIAGKNVHDAKFIEQKGKAVSLEDLNSKIDKTLDCIAKIKKIANYHQLRGEALRSTSAIRRQKR